MVSVIFYGLKAKRDDVCFRTAFAEANQWTPEQVDEFLSKNDTGIFRNKTVEEALSLIQVFRDVGVVGAIGGLENVGYSAKQFEKFYQNDGRFKITWNWAAAIFSGLWLLFKGLWEKFLIYSMVVWLLEQIIPEAVWNYINWPIRFFFLGVVGNYDYFLKKEKGESFWPKFPYQRLKTSFWLLFIVFFGYAFIYPSFSIGMRIANMKQQTITSFSADEVEFKVVPNNWKVYENPPVQFPLYLHRRIGANTSESLSYPASVDTKLMGYIQKDNPKNESELESLGLLALHVKKPNISQKFNAVRGQLMEKMASSVAGFDKIPFYWKWLEPTPTTHISYEEISGREWGRLASTVEKKMMKSKMKFHLTVYWTVVDGKAVMFLTESFSPYKDEIENQSKQFLGSLKME